MKKRAKYITYVFLLLILCLFALASAYIRSPEYVHQHLTPLYEQEAKCFYFENEDVLLELIDAIDKLDPNTWYMYTLHIGSMQDNPQEIPDSLARIFLKLEERTAQPYSISIIHGTSTIAIKSGSYFEVYLYYGYNQLHSLKPEWDKQIDLTSGWEIHSPYIIRA